MGTPIPFPLINGVRHDFTSIELKLDDQLYIGFKSVNFSATRSRSMVMGNHPDPIGKTKGTNEYKADCELYLAEWNLLQQKLGKGWQDKAFTMLVTYGANGFDTVVVEITGCTLDGTDFSHSQGTDALSVKVDLNPMKILINGIDGCDVVLGPPPGA